MQIPKDEARKIVQKRLESMSDEDYATLSLRVVEQLVSLLETRKDIHSILIYKPIKQWREVDVTSLPALFPTLQFDFVQSAKDAPFPEKQYDIIIVPLFGFTKDGYRLGHGSGWYDRFLVTQLNTLIIGVGYENVFVDFQLELHDKQMDVIVTEKQQYRFHSSELSVILGGKNY